MHAVANDVQIVLSLADCLSTAVYRLAHDRHTTRGKEAISHTRRNSEPNMTSFVRVDVHIVRVGVRFVRVDVRFCACGRPFCVCHCGRPVRVGRYHRVKLAGEIFGKKNRNLSNIPMYFLYFKRKCSIFRKILQNSHTFTKK